MDSTAPGNILTASTIQGDYSSGYTLQYFDNTNSSPVGLYTAYQSEAAAASRDQSLRSTSHHIFAMLVYRDLDTENEYVCVGLNYSRNYYQFRTGRRITIPPEGNYYWDPATGVLKNINMSPAVPNIHFAKVFGATGQKGYPNGDVPGYIAAPTVTYNSWSVSVITHDDNYGWGSPEDQHLNLFAFTVTGESYHHTDRGFQVSTPTTRSRGTMTPHGSSAFSDCIT